MERTMPYAVAKGHTTGIVSTWEECKSRIDGYKGAVFKKFACDEDAEAFLRTTTAIVDIEQSTIHPEYYVYTDGSCSNNGRPNAAAGIGIYFGENDARNVSQRLEGKQSNNVAELTAIRNVYTILRKDIDEGKRIGIVSDSEYAIRCVTSYGAKCEREGWAKDIPNKELVKEVYELYKGRSTIQFLHIMAHTNKKDIHSLGNDGADKLANRAIGLEECPYFVTERIVLNVPFVRKEEAKALGAKWDASKKTWYIMSTCQHKEEILRKFC